MGRWTKSQSACFAFLTPALVWLMAFFLGPLLVLWVISLGQKAGFDSTSFGWTLRNYGRVFEPAYLKVFLGSFWIALLASVLTLMLALPVSMAIAFSSPLWRPWLLFMVVLPFWTNMLIRTYALIVVLRTYGLINSVLDTLFGWVGLSFVPIDFLYTQGAVVLGLTYISLPFMVFPIYAQLEKLDHTYLEASADLGAGSVRTFFSIIIPLILPGIVSGFLLTFIPNLGAYLVPDLLGSTPMVANVIAAEFKNINDWPFGSALSFTLMLVALTIVTMRSLILRWWAA